MNFIKIIALGFIMPFIAYSVNASTDNIDINQFKNNLQTEFQNVVNVMKSEYKNAADNQAVLKKDNQEVLKKVLNKFKEVYNEQNSNVSSDDKFAVQREAWLAYKRIIQTAQIQKEKEFFYRNVPFSKEEISSVNKGIGSNDDAIYLECMKYAKDDAELKTVGKKNQMKHTQKPSYSEVQDFNQYNNDSILEQDENLALVRLQERVDVLQERIKILEEKVNSNDRSLSDNGNVEKQEINDKRKINIEKFDFGINSEQANAKLEQAKIEQYVTTITQKISDIINNGKVWKRILGNFEEHEIESYRQDIANRTNAAKKSKNLQALQQIYDELYQYVKNNDPNFTNKNDDTEFTDVELNNNVNQIMKNTDNYKNINKYNDKSISQNSKFDKNKFQTFDPQKTFNQQNRNDNFQGKPKQIAQ